MKMLKVILQSCFDRDGDRQIRAISSFFLSHSLDGRRQPLTFQLFLLPHIFAVQVMCSGLGDIPKSLSLNLPADSSLSL